MEDRTPLHFLIECIIIRTEALFEEKYKRFGYRYPAFRIILPFISPVVSDITHPVLGTPDLSLRLIPVKTFVTDITYNIISNVVGLTEFFIPLQ